MGKVGLKLLKAKGLCAKGLETGICFSCSIFKEARLISSKFFTQ
jgi:hypothetical protein